MHLLAFFIVSVAIAFLAFVGRGMDWFGSMPSPMPLVSQSPIFTPTPVIPQPSPSPLKSKVLLEAPFVAQAPTGNWKDPRQQDGCEEAASYMAYLWATGQDKPRTSQEQEEVIIAISEWEEENYGGYQDTSASDTAERILKSYFNLSDFEVKSDIKADDIRRALSDGNVVLVPANGQALNNPNFTPPGPERHFLLIKGYDLSTDEFITNDNGTRQGEGYRYKTEVLMNAIRDYPTGYHEPIPETRKAIIIVSRE